MVYLIVFLGAGIGGVFRHSVNVGAARLLGFGFPSGTLTVNILGSVLMGVLTELFVIRSGLPQSSVRPVSSLCTTRSPHSRTSASRLRTQQRAMQPRQTGSGGLPRSRQCCLRD